MKYGIIRVYYTFFAKGEVIRMKYYIVALFDEDSYEDIGPIQKKVSKKFRANRNSPLPYIALDILDNPNLDKLNVVMEKVLKPYKKFKIQVLDDVSVCESLKTVNLKIEDRGYIKKIGRNLNENLSMNGINSKIPSEDEVSISLANINYINKDKKYENSIQKEQLHKNGNNLVVKVSKFELWKISNNKKEVCLKSFCLRSF